MKLLKGHTCNLLLRAPVNSFLTQYAFELASPLVAGLLVNLIHWWTIPHFLHLSKYLCLHVITFKTQQLAQMQFAF